jgi:hypothetical protein
MPDNLNDADGPLVRTLKSSEDAEISLGGDDGEISLSGLIDFLSAALRRLKSGTLDLNRKSFVVAGLPNKLTLKVFMWAPVQGSLFHRGRLEDSAAGEQKQKGTLESQEEKKAAERARRLAKRAAKVDLSAEEIDVELGLGETRRLTKSFFNRSRDPETIGNTLAGQVKVGGRIMHPHFFPAEGEILFQNCRIVRFLRGDSIVLRFDSVIHGVPLRARLGDDSSIRCYISLAGEKDPEAESLIYGAMFADVQLDCVVSETFSTTKRGEWIFAFERFSNPVALLKQISAASQERLLVATEANG